jgi:uncharacterized protein YgbK (DUF1537 family)
MGRVCVHGVVQADGRVVGAVRDHLPEATVLRDPTSVGAWLQGGRGIAVADAQTTERMVEVVEAASGVDDVVVAGPAGPVGAAFRARFGAMAAAPVPRPDGAVLVVNGSASQAAHEQLRRLRATRPDVEVVSVPEGGLDLRPEVAQAVVARAAQSAASAAVVVLIGGDTAAAFLGDEPRRVGGFAAPGMPWSLDARDGGPLVITKAGAFGGPDALSDVLRRLAD